MISVKHSDKNIKQMQDKKDILKTIKIKEVKPNVQI